jgi:hypothetical protein
MKPKIKKGITIGTLVTVIVFAGYLFFKFYFVFSEGVKTGELNYLIYKGYVFKTYEGKMVEAGRPSQSTDTIQSNIFQFSVKDKVVADSLMRCSGKDVELHYKEYLGVLPWRGVNKFIVDKIVSVKSR